MSPHGSTALPRKELEEMLGSTSREGSGGLFTSFPDELVIHLLAGYGLAAKDMGKLEVTCNYFRTPSFDGRNSGLSLTQIAAKHACMQQNILPFVVTNLEEVISDFRNWTLVLQHMEGLAVSYSQKLGFISAGADYSIVVASSGSVYGFGNNMFCELGCTDQEVKMNPQKLHAAEYLCTVQVSGGLRHTLFVTGDSDVYACGDNSTGACGKQLTELVRIPRKVPGLGGIQVEQVAAGNRFSCFRSDDGTLYTCGSGLSGCLGHGTWTSTSVPQHVEALLGWRVEQVSAGDAHVLAVVSGRDHTREVFSWGRGRGGRLGHGTYRDEVLPRLVSGLTHSSIIAVAAGYEHSLALSLTGQCFSWGCNEHGALGLSDEDAMYTETNRPVHIHPIRPLRIVSIAAGLDCSFFVTNGELFGCGHKFNGRLGLPMLEYCRSRGEFHPLPIVQKQPVKIEDLAHERVVQVSSSHLLDNVCHTLVLCESGTVYSFGDGAVGQLGRGQPEFSHADRVDFVRS